MEGTPNKRRSKRSAAVSAQSFTASTTVKQEPLEEAFAQEQSDIPCTDSLQEASLSNCTAEDPLGDASDSDNLFKSTVFTIEDLDMKVENIKQEESDEIEDEGDIVALRTKKRKASVQDESGNSSSVARHPLPFLSSNPIEESVRCADSQSKIGTLSIVFPNTSKKAKMSPEAEIAWLKSKVERLEQENSYLKELLQEKFDVLIRNSTQNREAMGKLVSISCPKPGVTYNTECVFKQVNNEEEANMFDNMIRNDSSYKSNVVHYLRKQIDVVDVDSRLHKAIDLIFTRPFFATMSWTGKSKPGTTKLEFRKFKGILGVLKEIGSNETIVATPKHVADFVKIRLKHAPSRINLSPTKQTSLHNKKIKKIKTVKQHNVKQNNIAPL